LIAYSHLSQKLVGTYATLVLMTTLSSYHWNSLAKVTHFQMGRAGFFVDFFFSIFTFFFFTKGGFSAIET
jgi:hypothetical protein